MVRTHQVTAADICIDPTLVATYPTINFAVADVQKLPFKSKQFDTVVCAHTLEHVTQYIRSLK